MPLRQDTFKLVPEVLKASGPPRPPMTSRAVKKAYRKQQGPAPSKEEQRREIRRIQQELKEEEEQRKCYGPGTDPWRDT